MIYSKNSKKKIYHDYGCPYAKIEKGWETASKKTLEGRGYRPCSWCCGMHGIYLKYKQNRGWQDIHFAFDWKYEGRICFRTDNGFWNVRRSEHGQFWLYHLNGGQFDPDAKDKTLMNRSFHRQKDVKETENLDFILHYIREHDRMKQIMDDDWRNLPKTTKRKRKYYNQARKRANRKAARRLDKLFKQIEKGENGCLNTTLDQTGTM